MIMKPMPAEATPRLSEAAITTGALVSTNTNTTYEASAQVSTIAAFAHSTRYARCINRTSPVNSRTRVSTAR